MKIGIFATHYPYKGSTKPGVAKERVFWGGVAEVTYQLARNLAYRGHEVHVFTTSFDSNEHVETEHDVIIHRYGSRLRIGHTYVSFDLLQKPLKYQLDIVHGQLGTPPAPLAALRYARKRKSPFVLTYHFPETNSGNFVSRAAVAVFNRFLLKKLLSKAAAIIALSKHAVKQSKYLPNYETKITCIPNGIRLEELNVTLSKSQARKALSLSDNDMLILFVGGLVSRKAPDILLSAMPQILQYVANARLIFVGAGLMQANLNNLASKLGIGSRVTFTGFVGEELKLLYYKASDIFVLPSREGEGFGLVLLEASAFGLPLVVSDLEAFKAIVEDGENGLVTRRDDEKDLANKIIALLQNEELRGKLGSEARRKAQEFSWSKVAEEKERLYKEVLKRT